MSKPINWQGVDVHLEEGQRQMVLLALARLAVDRPGFLFAIEEIAGLMDNKNPEGKPELLHRFMELNPRGSQ